MNKPSKKQLVDCVTHYQTAVQNLVDTYKSDPKAEEFVEALVHMQKNAPSLEPVAKAVVEPSADGTEQAEAEEAVA